MYFDYFIHSKYARMPYEFGQWTRKIQFENVRFGILYRLPKTPVHDLRRKCFALPRQEETKLCIY